MAIVQLNKTLNNEPRFTENKIMSGELEIDKITLETNRTRENRTRICKTYLKCCVGTENRRSTESVS